ncbi:MAG: sugar permease [Herbinix sp.]|nr:sugar permease [Herbinix sp.]
MKKTKMVSKLIQIVKHILLLGLSFVWIYPFLWMVSASFKTKSDFFADRLGIIPRNVTFDNFKRVWTEAHFDKYFINTVIVTAVTVLLVLIMTAMAGYVLGRYSFFGKNLILLIFVASITIPLVSTVIPTYQVVKNMHLVGTRTGLILAGAGGAHVVFLMLFSGYFKQIPKEMEEAAKIDGCGFFQLFLSVMLPLAKPIATTVVIMETVWTWNAFLLPLVLTLSNPSSRTLAVGLYAFKGENTIDWTGIAAGGTVSVIPIILLFLLTQKYFVDGIAGAVKS